MEIMSAIEAARIGKMNALQDAFEKQLVGLNESFRHNFAGWLDFRGPMPDTWSAGLYCRYPDPQPPEHNWKCMVATEAVALTCVATLAGLGISAEIEECPSLYWLISFRKDF